MCSGSHSVGTVWQLLDTRSVGGIERHVATLSDALNKRGVSVEIRLLQNHGVNPWLAQLAGLGVPYDHLDGTLSGLRRAMQRERPALVHTHGYKAGILGRLAALSLGIPAVSTFHSGERPGYPLRAYYALDNWTSISARRIAVSRDIQQRLPYSAALIPNFVALASASAPMPAPSQLPRRIGFVGRLSQEKGPDLFCEIARSSDAKVEWHVFGDGPMRAELERVSGDRVRFHGVVEDMAKVWPTLGALLMPSRFEGLPLAALEAMGNGVPVIASRVGGVPGLIRDGETGFTFEPGDMAAAQQCIARWAGMDAGSLANLRLAARAHVEEHYSPDAQVPHIIDVYRSTGWHPDIPRSRHAQTRSVPDATGPTSDRHVA